MWNVISKNRNIERAVEFFKNNSQNPRSAHAKKKYGLSQAPTAQAQRFACLLWHCHRFATVILFALFLPTLHSTLPSSFLRWQRAVPTPKKQSKKTLHSNHHHRSVYASMQIGGS
jgi:hypothetical protein